MDFGRASLVLCATIFVVILINMVIYYIIAGNKGQDAKIFSRILAKGRNPWKQNYSDMEELSRRVGELKKRELSEQEIASSQEKDEHGR
jgi:hypothetical protein